MVSPRLSGLTLIETLVYSVLVTMILAVTLSTSLSFQSSTRKDKARIEKIANERFVGQKLDWLLYDLAASEIIQPDQSGTALEIRKSSGERYRLEIANDQFGIRRDTMQDDAITSSDAFYRFTNRHVTVTGASFNRVTWNSQAVLEATITVVGNGETGLVTRKVILR